MLTVLATGGLVQSSKTHRGSASAISKELGYFAQVPVSTHLTSAEGKRDTVYLFEANLVGEPRPDRIEVVETCFFEVDALPDAISPATARRLSERRGAVSPNGSW